MNVWDYENYERNSDKINEYVEELRNPPIDRSNDSEVLHCARKVRRVWKGNANLTYQLEENFEALQKDGERKLTNKETLPDDPAGPFRKSIRREKNDLGTHIYVFDFPAGGFNCNLGISMDPETNIFTAYIADVVRFLAPQHTVGRFLGSLLQRAASTDGVDGEIDMFPPSYAKHILPLDKECNDGSAIAVRFRLNTHKNGKGLNHYEVETLSINFEQINDVEFVSCQDINRALRRVIDPDDSDTSSDSDSSSENEAGSENEEEENHTDNIDLGSGSSTTPPKQKVYGHFLKPEDEAHLRNINDQLVRFRTARLRDIPQMDRRRYTSPVLENNAIIKWLNPLEKGIPVITATKNEHSLQFLQSGCTLFEELSNITNQAIGSYCNKKNLPIFYRGSVNDGGGNPKLVTRLEPNVGARPIKGGEAGMDCFAPCIRAADSALDYANQFLLLTHLSYRDEGEAEETRLNPVYDTTRTVPIFQAFHLRICAEGIERFVCYTHHRATAFKIFHSEIRRKTVFCYFQNLLDNVGLIKIKQSLIFEYIFRLTLTNVERVTNEENEEAVYRGHVFIKDLEFGLNSFSFVGQVQNLWNVGAEISLRRHAEIKAVLHGIDMITNGCIFLLDHRSIVDN